MRRASFEKCGTHKGTQTFYPQNQKGLQLLQALLFLILVGGAKGDRTPDLMTASHALSQLSYGPTRFFRRANMKQFHPDVK